MQSRVVEWRLITLVARRAAVTPTAATATALAGKSATATATAVFARSCDIHADRAVVQTLAIQLADGFLGIFRRCHFHECKSFRSTRIALRHDGNGCHVRNPRE